MMISGACVRSSRLTFLYFVFIFLYPLLFDAALEMAVAFFSLCVGMFVRAGKEDHWIGGGKEGDCIV